MHRKPTTPFGHIAFGPDGKVSKHIEVLSSEKRQQEEAIAKRFAVALEQTTGVTYTAQLCEENDHDFVMRSQAGSLIVQATEIVARDYLRALPAQEDRSFREFVVESTDIVLGVDEEAKLKVFTAKIEKKLSKRYAKPSSPFWLLIWTVRADLMPFYWIAGRHIASPGVEFARNFMANQPNCPFDEIWFFHPQVRPQRIWPN